MNRSEQSAHNYVLGVGALIVVVLIGYKVSHIITLSSVLWSIALLIHLVIVAFMMMMARSSGKSVALWAVIGLIFPIVGLALQMGIIYVSLRESGATATDDYRGYEDCGSSTAPQLDTHLVMTGDCIEAQEFSLYAGKQ